MMMNRDRLGFWTRFFAIGLAAVFIFSGIFFGMGSGISYNPLDLFGGDNQSGGQTVDQQKQIEQQTQSAEKDLKKNPDDPDNITQLAGLYYQNNRVDDAAKVLEEGQKKAPKNGDIPMFLGQVYSQQAQGASKDKERKDLQKESADAFAKAADIDSKNEEAYLYAGETYSQAGDPGQAIKYWNGYLKLEPNGKQAKEVRQRIDETLKGGNTTGVS